MHWRILVGLVLGTLLLGTAQGADTTSGWQSLVEAAKAQGLSSHPQWLRLLHFDRAGTKSEIISDDFFLSSEGRTNPEAELEATFRAYFSPLGANADEHARCRFPARYFWINQHTPLPGYDTRDSTCERLQQWARLDRVRSASLILVSGYFGNPASAFGHALLRFNTSETGAEELLDLTFNFGALVPPNELTALYVYKGITGGYQAGFSDSQYYAQDLVYARTEFRDMWNYELSLSQDALTLTIYHLWEITGKKFTYYFLTENCAYRLAEIMELATGESFLARASASYAPVEMFHRLHVLNDTRPEPLIRSIRFMPSSQRVLYRQFGELSEAEATAANTLIREGTAGLHQALLPFTESRKIEIVDALLAYYEYRIAAAGDDGSTDLREAKDEILRARLRLPVHERPDLKVAALPSPAQGSAPMLWAGGAGWQSTSSTYTRLQWSPFYYDLLGQNGLQNAELIALDVAVGLDRRGDVFLEHLDLIRVRELNTNRIAVAGERSLSWHARAGAERYYREGKARTRGFVELGVGRSMAFAHGLLAYASIDGSLNTGASLLAADPNVGLIWRNGRLSAWARGGARYDNQPGRWNGHTAIDARYQLSQHRALRLELSHDEETRVLLSLMLYQ